MGAYADSDADESALAIVPAIRRVLLLTFLSPIEVKRRLLDRGSPWRLSIRRAHRRRPRRPGYRNARRQSARLYCRVLRCSACRPARVVPKMRRASLQPDGLAQPRFVVEGR